MSCRILSLESLFLYARGPKFGLSKKETIFSISSGASEQWSGLCLWRNALHPSQLCINGGLWPRGPMTLWTWITEGKGLQSLSHAPAQPGVWPFPEGSPICRDSYTRSLFQKTPYCLQPNPWRKAGGRRGAFSKMVPIFPGYQFMEKYSI